MARKPQKIDVTRVPDKWLNLLLHAQHGSHPVHRCIFHTEDSAKTAYTRMAVHCDHNTNLHLAISRRRNEVLIAKLNFVQDVIIEGF